MLIQNVNAPGQVQTYERTTQSTTKPDQLCAIKLTDGKFTGELRGSTKLLVPLSQAAETLISLGDIDNQRDIVLPRIQSGDGEMAVVTINVLADGNIDVKIKRSAAIKDAAGNTAGNQLESATQRITANRETIDFSKIAHTEKSDTENQTRIEKLKKYINQEAYITAKTAKPLSNQAARYTPVNSLKTPPDHQKSSEAKTLSTDAARVNNSDTTAPTVVRHPIATPIRIKPLPQQHKSESTRDSSHLNLSPLRSTALSEHERKRREQENHVAKSQLKPRDPYHEQLKPDAYGNIARKLPMDAIIKVKQYARSLAAAKQLKKVPEKDFLRTQLLECMRNIVSDFGLNPRIIRPALFEPDLIHGNDGTQVNLNLRVHQAIAEANVATDQQDQALLCLLALVEAYNLPPKKSPADTSALAHLHQQTQNLLGNISAGYGHTGHDLKDTMINALKAEYANLGGANENPNVYRHSDRTGQALERVIIKFPKILGVDEPRLLARNPVESLDAYVKRLQNLPEPPPYDGYDGPISDPVALRNGLLEALLHASNTLAKTPHQIHQI